MPSGSNVYKLTFQFIEATGDTFSEVYYTGGNTAQDPLNIPASVFIPRLALLDASVTWQRVRVANVLNTRLTAQRTLNWAGTSTATGGPSPSGSSMVCNMVGATGGSRKLWMRGLPQEFIVRQEDNGRPNFPAEVLSTFTAFATGMGSFGCGIRQLVQSQHYPIASVANSTTSGQAIITFTLPAGFAPPTWASGGRALIAQSDKKTLPGLTGQFTILNVLSPLSILVRYLVPGTAPITQNTGYLRQVSYGALSVFNGPLCSPAYYGTHSTRSPFSNSRGSRRAVRLRTLA